MTDIIKSSITIHNNLNSLFGIYELQINTEVLNDCCIQCIGCEIYHYDTNKWTTELCIGKLDIDQKHIIYHMRYFVPDVNNIRIYLQGTTYNNNTKNNTNIRNITKYNGACCDLSDFLNTLHNVSLNNQSNPTTIEMNTLDCLDRRIFITSSSLMQNNIRQYTGKNESIIDINPQSLNVIDKPILTRQQTTTYSMPPHIIISEIDNV